jgi:hypothetical protein
MSVVVHTEDFVLTIHEHPVDPVAESPLAPRVNEITVAVVDHHGVIATAVEVHVEIRVSAHGSDVIVTEPGRQALPVFD